MKRMTIMKRSDDNGDDNMSEKITKAQATAEWETARDEYLKRHGLSFAKGVPEFAVTQEAARLYNKILRAEPGLPIAKRAQQPLSKAQEVAALENVTFETLASESFPGDTMPTAVEKFMKTSAGRAAYEQYLAEKAKVGIR
jgi:hypothetical protein